MNRRLATGGATLALLAALLCGPHPVTAASTSAMTSAEPAATVASAPAAVTTSPAMPAEAAPAANAAQPAAPTQTEPAAGDDLLPFLKDRGDKTSSEQLPDVPDMSSTIVKMIVTMVLIVAALLGGAWLFNRYARRRLVIGGGDRSLRLVSRVALGSRKSACVLSVGGRLLLLGVGEHDVNLLLELDLPAADEHTDFTKALTEANVGSGETASK